MCAVQSKAKVELMEFQDCTNKVTLWLITFGFREIHEHFCSELSTFYCPYEKKSHNRSERSGMYKSLARDIFLFSSETHYENLSQ